MNDIHIKDKFYMEYVWCKETPLELLYITHFCVTVNLLEDMVNFFDSDMIINMGYMGYW